ncbi:hypothetical protein FQA39_LY07091 [Lamprigera yunnana]|nr:hypothetical protein FQA39_LY07091 [Lamprigera yunnana]
MASLLLSKFCCISNVRTVALRKLPQHTTFRNFAEDVRQSVRRARQKTLREKIMAPAGEGAFTIGKGAIAGGAAVGVGALCYYGLGLSNEAGAAEKSIVSFSNIILLYILAFTIGKGAIAGGAAVGVGALCYYGLGLSNEAGAAEKSILWPEYVKKRIQTAYFYFGSSLVVTAASAMASFRSPTIMNIVTKNGLLGLAISLGAIMGTGILAQSIPYKDGFGTKQMAWLLHTGTLGAMLAPMCFMGGPILIRAAWYTAGIVGGLSTIAVCAPSEKFLTMGAPLGMGLGVVFASSIGSMLLPPTSAFGAGLYSISLYGGLLLFSAFMLYDTQRIIAQAERYPVNNYTTHPYDPINTVWPDYVKKRIRTTFFYVGGSLIITALSSLHAYSSLRFRPRFLGSFGVMIISGLIAQTLPYKEGIGFKKIAWFMYSQSIGVMTAQLMFTGGGTLIRAFCYSAGLIGGLSAIAVCAPTRKFLNMGAPLGMGLGVVIAASLGSIFIPSTTLHAVSLYGGLFVFSGFLLYDTQSIILQAEMYPIDPEAVGALPYDPINAAMLIYIDIINIFLHILSVLEDQDSRN